MLMLISLTYCGLIWLLFFKFKLLPWNPKTRAVSTLAGVALILGIVILMTQGSPQATGGIQITTKTVNLQAYSRGRVTKIHVQSYQRMRRGDPIVEVDKTPYEYTVRQLEASLEGAIQGVKQMEADLAGAKANVKVVEANIATAESSIAATKANTEAAQAALAQSGQLLAAARASVTRNESNVKTAQIQIPRIRKLVEQKVNPQSDLDNAENKVVAAQAGLDAAKADEARAQDGVLGSEAAVRAAQAYEEQARRSQTSLRAQLLAAQATENKAQALLASMIDGEHTSVRQVREQLATARFNLEQTVVYAPDDGYVAAFNITVGDMLMLGQFGTYVLTGHMFAMAAFSQATVRHIKPGQTAEIAFARLPGEIIKAEVEAVVWASGEAQMTQSATLPKIDQIIPARSVMVRFKLNPVDGFEPTMGTSGTVAIYTDHGKAFAIIRKIMLRIASLLYYLG